MSNFIKFYKIKFQRFSFLKFLMFFIVIFFSFSLFCAWKLFFLHYNLSSILEENYHSTATRRHHHQQVVFICFFSCLEGSRNKRFHLRLKSKLLCFFFNSSQFNFLFSPLPGSCRFFFAFFLILFICFFSCFFSLCFMRSVSVWIFTSKKMAATFPR